MAKAGAPGGYTAVNRLDRFCKFQELLSPGLGRFSCRRLFQVRRKCIAGHLDSVASEV